MQNNTDENFNEDFERLLKQFVSEKYKDVKLDDMQTEDDEDPFLEDEDVDEYEAEDNTPTEKADDIYTDSPLPGDVIEQNQNVRVKVEILRPIDNPKEELQKLVGCGNIKKRMDELVALTAYNRMLHEQFPELKQHRVSLHSLFLGNPGTGKTTTVNAILQLLENEAERVALCAPTGRAAKRLSELTGRKASSIHRLLEVDYTVGVVSFIHNDKNLLKCDVVILD